MFLFPFRSKLLHVFSFLLVLLLFWCFSQFHTPPFFSWVTACLYFLNMWWKYGVYFHNLLFGVLLYHRRSMFFHPLLLFDCFFIIFSSFSFALACIYLPLNWFPVLVTLFFIYLSALHPCIYRFLLLLFEPPFLFYSMSLPCFLFPYYGGE